MKTVLPNCEETIQFLQKCPKLYLVAYWACWGVSEYAFSGKYKTIHGVDYPLVWDYDDHNGTDDSWYLRPICDVTTGEIITWTPFKMHSMRIANALNYKEG